MMKPLVLTSLFALLSGLAWAKPATADRIGNLTVEIQGLKNQQGQVCLALFSNASGFPDNTTKAVDRRCLAIPATTVTTTFQGVRAGSYAIAVYHDRNKDNRFNRNDLGMPVEGYGFSNNPKVRTSAPKFGEALILVAGQNTRANIQMFYEPQ